MIEGTPLEPGDVVTLAVSASPETPLAPFGNERLQLMLGTELYPDLEDQLVGQHVGATGAFELLDREDGAESVEPVTTLEDVIPQRVASLIEEVGTDSPWAFLETDPGRLAEESHGMLDAEAVAEFQEDVGEALSDRHRVEYEVLEAFRRREQEGKSGARITKLSEGKSLKEIASDIGMGGLDCPQCGVDLDQLDIDGSILFCPSCGSSLGDQQQEEQLPPETMEKTVNTGYETSPRPDPQPTGEDNKGDGWFEDVHSEDDGKGDPQGAGDGWFEDVPAMLDQVPILVIVDTSEHAVTDYKVGAELERVEEYLERFKDAQDSFETENRHICLVTYGEDVTIEQDFTPLMEWTPPKLKGSGTAPMCDAIKTGLNHLEDFKSELDEQSLPRRRAQVWLFTTGAHNCSKESQTWEKTKTMIEIGVREGEITFYATLTDETGDEAVLEALLSEADYIGSEIVPSPVTSESLKEYSRIPLETTAIPPKEQPECADDLGPMDEL